MSTLSHSFTEAGVSTAFSLKPGESASYAVTGTFTGYVFLEESQNLLTFQTVVAGAVDTGFSGTLKNETLSTKWYRFRAADTDALTPITGTAVCSMTDATDVVQEFRNLKGDVVLRLTDAGIEVPGTLGVTGAVTAASVAATTISGAPDAGSVTREKLALAVINKTGSSIAANKLVAVLGLDATSGKPTIVLADADVAAHDDVWVTTEAIADAAEGTVVKGVLSAASIDTSGATTAGDPIYLSITAGGFVHTAPTGATARVQPVGFVVVKHASTGQILWSIGPTRISGTNEIQAASITSALLAASVGNSSAYAKTATGTNNVLANATGARAVLIMVVVNETFADGDGAQTAFTIGEESGSATKYAAAAAFIGKTAGYMAFFTGTLTTAKKVQVYATAATGTGTGGITVVVIAVPAT